MRHIILLILLTCLTFTSCTPAPETIVIYESLDAEGEVCLPYSPEGSVVYNSEWSGTYPLIEAFDKPFKTVTLAMGCFWGPAAEYATVNGVLRTRVGYSGGDLTTPSYNNLGNHIEVFEVDYDPEVISYEQLVELYFVFYDATMRPISLRVKPVIYYRTEEVYNVASRIKQSIEAASSEGIFAVIEPFDIFYLAENKHQLSYLKQESSLYDEITQIFQDEDQLLLSILASKLNGFIPGYGDPNELALILKDSGLSDPSLNRIETILKSYN